MQLFLKILISLAVILVATAIGRKMPSAAGLIGVMPLTGALVLAWVYIENRGDQRIMENFTKGSLWGILPSILFFLVALFCFKKDFSLVSTLLLSFSAWVLAAFLHQWILR